MTQEASPKFLYYTEKDDDGKDELCITYKAKGQYLTVGELANVLNTLLKNHPEFKDTPVDSAYEEAGLEIEIKPNSFLIQ